MFQILDETRTFSSGARVGFLKNGDPTPHLIVTFDSYICGELGWENSCDLCLQIGTNSYQGLLRVSVSPEPTGSTFEMHMEGARIDFGPISTLCKVTRHPRTTQATVFYQSVRDGNWIQIKIPEWEENLPNFSTAVKKPVAPVRGKPKIIFKPYPMLIYNGTEMPLYEFQAVLLEPLTHTIGGIFPPKVIVERGYHALGSVPHPAIEFLLPTEMEGLRVKLRAIKLDLKIIKGMGYSLNAMEE